MTSRARIRRKILLGGSFGGGSASAQKSYKAAQSTAPTTNVQTPEERYSALQDQLQSADRVEIDTQGKSTGNVRSAPNRVAIDTQGRTVPPEQLRQMEEATRQAQEQAVRSAYEGVRTIQATAYQQALREESAARTQQRQDNLFLRFQTSETQQDNRLGPTIARRDAERQQQQSQWRSTYETGYDKAVAEIQRAQAYRDEEVRQIQETKSKIKGTNPWNFARTAAAEVYDAGASLNPLARTVGLGIAQVGLGTFAQADLALRGRLREAGIVRQEFVRATQEAGKAIVSELKVPKTYALPLTTFVTPGATLALLGRVGRWGRTAGAAAVTEGAAVTRAIGGNKQGTFRPFTGTPTPKKTLQQRKPVSNVQKSKIARGLYYNPKLSRPQGDLLVRSGRAAKETERLSMAKQKDGSILSTLTTTKPQPRVQVGYEFSPKGPARTPEKVIYLGDKKGIISNPVQGPVQQIGNPVMRKAVVQKIDKSRTTLDNTIWQSTTEYTRMIRQRGDPKQIGGKGYSRPPSQVRTPKPLDSNGPYILQSAEYTRMIRRFGDAKQMGGKGYSQPPSQVRTPKSLDISSGPYILQSILKSEFKMQAGMSSKRVVNAPTPAIKPNFLPSQQPQPITVQNAPLYRANTAQSRAPNPRERIIEATKERLRKKYADRQALLQRRLKEQSRPDFATNVQLNTFFQEQKQKPRIKPAQQDAPLSITPRTITPTTEYVATQPDFARVALAQKYESKIEAKSFLQNTGLDFLTATKEKTKTSLATNQFSKSKSQSAQALSFVPAYQFQEALKFQTATMSKQKQQLQQQQKQTQRSQQRSTTKVQTRFLDTPSAPRPQTSQIQAKPPKRPNIPLFKPNFRQTQKPPEEPKQPKPVFLPRPQPKQPQKRVLGFNVFARIKGVDTKINTLAVPYSSALRIGAEFVGKTAARTFFVAESNETAVTTITEGVFDAKNFKKKGSKFVELSKFAINTPGELRDITFKGQAKRKNNLLSVFGRKRK